MTSLLPIPEWQLFDNDGKPLASGTVGFYIPGTLTQKATWQDASQAALNANPLTLDAAGRATVYGFGSYRVIVKDALGNQLYDALTDSALDESVISAILLPFLGAQSLSQARDLLGVTAAINAAVSAVSLLAGPAGPPGSAGGVGPVGPTGPQGSASGGSILAANPGFWKDTATGLVINFGIASSDGAGNATVSFAQPYVSGTLLFPIGAVQASTGGWWFNLSSYSNSGFTATTSSPFVGGLYRGGPVSFGWISLGI